MNGFSKTFEYFKMIIFEPKVQEITKDEFVKFSLLEKEVEFHNDMDYEELFLKIIIFVIILFYPCRYLFLILKWSIKQIKNNKTILR